MFGLLDRDIKYIIKALEQHDEIEKAIIFGSRAMGNYKKGSDVDIAIIGENVNAVEGAAIYGLGKTRIMTLAKEAGAVYKVGNSALINTEIFESYLEKFREPSRPLPAHIWNDKNKHRISVQKK